MYTSFWEKRRNLGPELRHQCGGDTFLKCLLYTFIVVTATAIICSCLHINVMQKLGLWPVQPAATTPEEVIVHHVVKVKVTPLPERDQVKYLTLQIFTREVGGDVSIINSVLPDNGTKVIFYVCDVPQGQEMWVDAKETNKVFYLIKIHVHDLNDVN